MVFPQRCAVLGWEGASVLLTIRAPERYCSNGFIFPVDREIFGLQRSRQARRRLGGACKGHDSAMGLRRISSWKQGHKFSLDDLEVVNARNSYERPITDDPRHAKCLRQLGWLYQQDNSCSQNNAHAIHYLKKSLEAGVIGDFIPTWYHIGRAYVDGQKYCEAHGAYQGAIRRDGGNPFWLGWKPAKVPRMGCHERMVRDKIFRGGRGGDGMYILAWPKYAVKISSRFSLQSFLKNPLKPNRNPNVAITAN
ncbi:hypothetical protein B0H13DRAFT_1857106 [Mycena leptocephala]|nr:hypothetical protein B0H13DRAFT_1857106 [Mycena leptocephala]